MCHLMQLLNAHHELILHAEVVGTDGVLKSYTAIFNSMFCDLQVLLSICSLLTDPNPDDPLVPEIAHM